MNRRAISGRSLDEPLRYLRSGLPTSSPLTVSPLPTVAKLDQNESPVDLPLDLKTSLLDELRSTEWNRYPQPSEYVEARRCFAEAVGVDPDRLVLTVGCDQAIQGAHFIAGGPDRRALVFEPTYPMLAHAGLLAGTSVSRVDLGLDYDLRPEHFDRDVHLILIASPNNPTGRCIPTTVIEHSLAGDRYVFVDEAYFDFSRSTVAHLVEDHPNLMIGRSCSKSLLAGMRLGYTISHPEVARRLDLLLAAPYHLSHAQLVIARRFSEIRPYVEEAASQTIAERGRLAAGLERLGFRVRPSVTNFMLIEVENAREVYDGLARAGIRLRFAPKIPGLDGHLRITVGSVEQDDLLLEVLASVLIAR